MAKKDVQVVSYSDVPLDAPKQKIGTFIIVMIVVLSIFSAATYFIFNTNVDDDKTIEEELNAVISLSDFGRIGVVGPEFDTWQGESFTLNGSESIGDVFSYEWDMDGEVDSDHDGIATNDADKKGKTISHIYNRLGQYTIRLWVFDAAGNSDKVQAKVKVSYREEALHASTSSPGNLLYERTFLVPSSSDTNTEVQKIALNISYMTSSSPQNMLNLSVYDGSGNYVSNGTYVLSFGSTKIITWEVGAQWLALYSPGTWTIRISQDAPLVQPRTIEFTYDLFILY